MTGVSFNTCNTRVANMKTKHQILFILCLAIALRTFGQAEIQNPVFPFWKVKGNSGTTAGTNFIGTTDAIDWVVKTNNTERLRVLSAGNVGIGTTTPAKLLDVNGDALVNGVTIGRGAGNGASNTALGNTALNSNTTGFVNTAVGLVALFSNTTGTDNTAVGYNTLYYNTTGIYNTATGTYALLNTTGSNNTGFGKNALYNNTTGSNNTAIGYDADVTSGGFTNATAIGYNARAGASNTLVLGNGANVGIGISVPTSKLVVVGAGSAATLPNTTSSAIFRVGVSANEGIDFGKAGTSPYAGWIQSGFSGTADPLSIQPLGGNVGIGTIAPTQALDVNGKIRMQTGAAVGYVPVSDATGVMTWTNPTSLTITETDPQVSSTTTSYVPRWNGTALVDGLIFDNATNVGIGTTSPLELLELRKNGFDNYIRVDAGNTSANSSGVKLYEVGNNFGWNMRFDASDDDVYFEHNNSGTITNLMKLDNLGNVGIGTTAPVNKLDVEGALAVGATYSGTNTAPTNGAIIEGNVGIGTTVPGYKLDVNGSVNSADNYYFTNSSGTGTTNPPFRIDGSADRLYVIAESNATGPNGTEIRLRTAAAASAATDRVTIDKNGNVGIAITAPTSTLHVNGAFATTVKTAQAAGTNNPDNTAAVWIYSSGTGTITLPGAATCSGRRYVIVNQTGAAVTTSSYINLATAAVTTLANNASVEVISDGTNWRQIK